MASMMLPGPVSLPWSRCNNLRLFTAGGARPFSINRLAITTTTIPGRGRIAATTTKTVCISTEAPPAEATSAESSQPSTSSAESSQPSTSSAESSQPPLSLESPPSSGVPAYRFDKPVSLVAGASRGLGLEFARQLLEKHPDSPVVATCRNPNSADNLMALKEQYPSRLTVMKLDVTEESTAEVVAKEISDKYGRLDLYINTVGVLHIPDVMTPERKLDELDRDSAILAFRINAVGPAIVAKHMMPLLKLGKGEGTGRGGAVIAHLSAKVGSIYDNKLGGWYAHRASKAGLNQLTRTIGVECLRLKEPVIVVLLHPGTVDTDLSKPFLRNVPPEILFTPAASVQKLLDIIDSLKPEDCAKFFAYDRQELPW